jgi:hypothetical protein
VGTGVEHGYINGTITALLLIQNGRLLNNSNAVEPETIGWLLWVLSP